MEKQKPNTGHGHHEGHAEHEGHEAHDKHDDEHGEAEYVELTADHLKAANVEITEAGRAKLQLRIILYGKISSIQDRLAHVAPRYPGVVLETRKRLGDRVKKDEVIAVIESNESLRPYDAKSLIGGTVIAKERHHRGRSSFLNPKTSTPSRNSV